MLRPYYCFMSLLLTYFLDNCQDSSLQKELFVSQWHQSFLIKQKKKRKKRGNTRRQRCFQSEEQLLCSSQTSGFHPLSFHLLCAFFFFFRQLCDFTGRWHHIFIVLRSFCLGSMILKILRFHITITSEGDTSEMLLGKFDDVSGRNISSPPRAAELQH